MAVSAVAALLILLGGSELRFLVSRVWALGLGAAPGLAVVAAAVMLGFAVFPARTWRGCSRVEACLFAFGCGAALVSCAMLVLGLKGWTSPGILRVLAGGCVVAGLARWACWAVPGRGGEWTKWIRWTDPDEATGGVRGTGWAGWLLGAAVSVAVGLLVTAAFAPPLVYDVTEYHMGALSDYAAAGVAAGSAGPRFVPVPWSMYARFPFPVESLYWFAALLAPPQDTGAKVVNAAFVIAGALLIGCWLRRAGVRPALRALAALAFLAHPLVLEVSIDAYIDAPSAFLVVAALYAMLVFEGAVGGNPENHRLEADDSPRPEPVSLEWQARKAQRTRPRRPCRVPPPSCRSRACLPGRRWPPSTPWRSCSSCPRCCSSACRCCARCAASGRGARLPPRLRWAPCRWLSGWGRMWRSTATRWNRSS